MDSESQSGGQNVEEMNPVDESSLPLTSCLRCLYDRDAKRPIDGGWAWVVLCGSIYVTIFVAPIIMTFGLIFSGPLLQAGVSSTTVAWIVNAHIFFWHNSSILSGPLCEIFGWRPVALVNFAVCSVAYTCLAISSLPLVIFLLFSVVVGVSGGIATSVVFLIVPAYFDKLKGRATAALTVGIGVGLIIKPPFLNLLIEELSYKGCILIYGAILANSCVVAMFFHPIEWHQPEETKKLKSKNHTCNLQAIPPNPESSSKATIAALFISVVGHLKNIRQLRILILSISFAGFMITYSNWVTQLPFALEEKGHGRNIAAQSISVAAISSTSFRMIISYISDKKWFNRKLCFINGLLISGSGCIVFPFLLESKELMFGCLIVWGIGTSFTMSTFHALIIDLCGRDLYVSGVCNTGFFWGTLSIVIGPCLGFIRDLSDYKWSMGSCGFIQIVCAALWLLMPCAIKADEGRRRGGKSTKSLP